MAMKTWKKKSMDDDEKQLAIESWYSGLHGSDQQHFRNLAESGWARFFATAIKWKQRFLLLPPDNVIIPESRSDPIWPLISGFLDHHDFVVLKSASKFLLRLFSDPIFNPFLELRAQDFVDTVIAKQIQTRIGTNGESPEAALLGIFADFWNKTCGYECTVIGNYVGRRVFGLWLANQMKNTESFKGVEIPKEMNQYGRIWWLVRQLLSNGSPESILPKECVYRYRIFEFMQTGVYENISRLDADILENELMKSDSALSILPKKTRKEVIDIVLEKNLDLWTRVGLAISSKCPTKLIDGIENLRVDMDFKSLRSFKVSLQLNESVCRALARLLLTENKFVAMDFFRCHVIFLSKKFGLYPMLEMYITSLGRENMSSEFWELFDELKVADMKRISSMMKVPYGGLDTQSSDQANEDKFPKFHFSGHLNQFSSRMMTHHLNQFSFRMMPQISLCNYEFDFSDNIRSQSAYFNDQRIAGSVREFLEEKPGQ